VGVLPGGRGRKWAAADKDPAKSWQNPFAIEETLDKTAAARAKVSDANSFLYLAKAIQLFLAGGKGSLEDGLKDVKAKVLLVPSKSDVLLFPDYSRRAMEILKKQGTPVEYVEIEGDGGHVEGVLALPKVGETVRQFLNQ
jgi:homoserine O-acetyltransferase